MATMLYEVTARVHVAVHTSESPSDLEWQEYLADIGAKLSAIDGIYSLTRGGGPNASQRSAAVAFWKAQRKEPPIAVVTPSMLVVRMAGALRWFMPGQIKAFGVSNTDGAFDYLHLSATQRERVRNSVRALEERLDARPRASTA